MTIYQRETADETGTQDSRFRSRKPADTCCIYVCREPKCRMRLIIEMLLKILTLKERGFSGRGKERIAVWVGGDAEMDRDG